MRNIVTIVITSVLSAALLGCGGTGTGPTNTMQEDNPLVEVSALEDMSEAAGFSVDFPDSVEGFGEVTSLAAAEDSLAQATYASDGGELVIRKGIAGDGEASVSDGDTNYPFETTDLSGGNDVTLRGDDASSIHVATWSYDGYDYAVLSSSALTLDDMLTIVNEVVFA